MLLPGSSVSAGKLIKSYFVTYFLTELSPSWESANSAAVKQFETTNSSTVSEFLSIPWIYYGRMAFIILFIYLLQIYNLLHSLQ
jgi:hypothetical protein